MNMNKLTTAAQATIKGGATLPSRRLRIATPGRILAAVLALSSAGAAQAIIIDSFSTNQDALSIVYTKGDKASSKSSSAAGPGILGGERTMTVSLTGGGTSKTQVQSVVSDGLYSYAQDPRICSLGVLQWDGVNQSSTLNPTGLGGADLTAGSSSALILGVDYLDVPVDVKIVVYSDAGNASSRTLTLAGGINSLTPYSFKYSDFTTMLGKGADFTKVGAVTLTTGSSVTAPDLAFDYLVTSESAGIPEPGTLALLGLGLAACGFCARSKKTVTQR